MKRKVKRTRRGSAGERLARDCAGAVECQHGWDCCPRCDGSGRVAERRYRHALRAARIASMGFRVILKGSNFQTPQTIARICLDQMRMRCAHYPGKVTRALSRAGGGKP